MTAPRSQRPDAPCATPADADTPPPTAAVLAGGGARAAYEAGVMQFVLDELPRRTGVRARFDTFTGTSAGALNTCSLAATAHRPAEGARELADYWRALTMDKVIRFRTRQMLAMTDLLFGRWREAARRGVTKKRPRGGPHPPVAGVFDTSPLRESLSSAIPWADLHRNVADRTVRGVALCATEVCTGKAVIFHEAAAASDFHSPSDPSKHAAPVTIGVDHAMASAAIPFVLPSIQVDGVCYVDGALHLNTPLFPAIRMGAERILVVGLTQEPRVRYNTARFSCRRNPYPGAVFLLGRLLGSFMDHQLDNELSRLEMFNRVLEMGCEQFGEPFLDHLGDISSRYRNTRYRPIRALHIRPSVHLNALAFEALREAPDELALPGPHGRLVKRVLQSRPLLESELTSFLMFCPTFTRRLVEQGFRDAEAREDELVAFFG